MSNSYFRFKEFLIEQDRCAMKVSTDACIQGAWTPISNSVKRVLDIGTGTGLLSLMLLQRGEKIEKLDALEIDAKASEQAVGNFSSSKWGNVANVINIDASEFSSKQKYDLIISNPPFFSNSLLGENQERNQARHEVNLNLSTLFNVIDKNLSDDGQVSILLPVEEHENWERLLKSKGWRVNRKLIVYPNSRKAANRIVSICSPNSTKYIEEQLYIRGEDNKYTEAFKKLLKPYYLNL